MEVPAVEMQHPCTGGAQLVRRFHVCLNALRGMGYLRRRETLEREPRPAPAALVIVTRLARGDQRSALRDEGIIPPGVDNPEMYRQRSGGVILPRQADWWEATADLRRAFVDRPELAPMASLGNA